MAGEAGHEARQGRARVPAYVLPAPERNGGMGGGVGGAVSPGDGGGGGGGGGTVVVITGDRSGYSNGFILANGGTGGNRGTSEQGENGVQGSIYVLNNSSVCVNNTINYPTTQSAMLSQAIIFSQQGFSSAISDDGNTVASGAPGAGSVLVWVRDVNDTWSLQTIITDSGFEEGYSVSLSGNGNILAIGSPGTFSDTVFIWSRSGTIWTLVQAIVGTPDTRFGHSVSLSQDGTVLVVGASVGGNIGQGSVDVWTFDGSIWNQQLANYVPPSSVGSVSAIGTSVYMSSSGTSFIVGGPSDTSVGVAWIVNQASLSWTNTPTSVLLTPSNPSGSGNQFGSSVSISGNGLTCIVGARLDNSSMGASWIFRYNGSNWIEQVKLVGTNGSSFATQGASVSISRNGLVVAVGGPGDNTFIGAVWIFALEYGTWSQKAKLIGSGNTPPTSSQGNSSALSQDGRTLVEGGNIDNSANGSVWIFVAPEVIDCGCSGS